jgi:hypothetical protein
MIQPPLCLVLLPAPAWDATGAAGTASLATLTAQLCLIARKLPKGVMLATLRAEMLAISRQIQAQAGAETPHAERVREANRFNRRSVSCGLRDVSKMRGGETSAHGLFQVRVQSEAARRRDDRHSRRLRPARQAVWRARKSQVG